MATNYAFVTLITSDSYLPGALALVAALKDIHPSPPQSPEVDFQTVCLVTPESVDVSAIKLLRKAFDVVIGVEIITQQDDRGLKLLGRPDLNTVLTKLHVFRLTQYSKIIFLDADVLPVRPLSHLFTLPYGFSAVPDVGWPDIFNSGVLVLSPGEDKFSELNQLLKSKGTWDGGDQGILNEWRGSDWNRLSFIYNTTPTAAYTYAPAYERFGSKISAIHFIGPNKPWNSISWRAPSTPSSQNGDPQQAYDYNSLVDRWYAVYDKHYRSHDVAPMTDFEVKRYTSAWDEQAGGTTFAPSVIPSGSALGLEDLRRIAVEGIGAFTGTSGDGFNEGQYKSMPLEGRVDLMRLQTVEEEPILVEPERPRTPSTPTRPQAPLWSDSPMRWETLPTPRPEEVPPAPHVQPFSLPSTPTPQRQYYQPPADRSAHHEHHEHHDDSHQHQSHEPHPQEHPLSQEYHQPQEYQQAQDRQQTREHQTQQHQTYEHHEHQKHGQSQEYQQIQERHQSEEQQQTQGHRQPESQQPHERHEQSYHDHHEGSHHHHHEHQHRQEPPRPSSPPMLIWNPAVEGPPNNPPTSSAFPSDTYFQNIWDQPPSQAHDRPHNDSASSHVRESSALFTPPPQPEIPEPLRRQGHYRNVTGEDQHGHTPSPDRTKVKNVFPWEEKPRLMPGRVFPASDAPPPALFVTPEPPAPPAPISVPAPSPPHVHPPPIHGLPKTLAYANAWDTVPSIQRYASRLVRPPRSLLPLAPAFDTTEWPRPWEDRAEASSRDGDVEDEGDDEEPDASGAHGDESEGERASSRSRSRSGSESISASYVIKGKKKEYRVRGVQTVAPDTRSQGVQVEIEVPPPLPDVKRMKSTSAGPATGGRRMVGPTLLPPAIIEQGKTLGAEASLSTAPASMQNTPTMSPVGVRSPREFAFPPTSPPTARPALRLQQVPPPPLKEEPMSRVSPPVLNERKLSNESSSIASPQSSVGPASPPEGLPIALPAGRKSGRVWDPARGVELFKRGSEEVLARFLKMGSWEDDAH